jgi:hypothetical protein
LYAISYFEKDECFWGLGQTYSLLGRVIMKINIIQDSEQSFMKAKAYFARALVNFELIDHWRGNYITLRDLHDLEQKQMAR